MKTIQLFKVRNYGRYEIGNENPQVMMLLRIIILKDSLRGQII